MSIKFIGIEGQESSVLPKESLMDSNHELISSHPRTIRVRDPQKIPKKIRDFFKVDLKSGQALPTDRKIFLSQVLMHELDEGVRILNRAGRHEIAESIISAHPKLHLSNPLS